MVVDANDDPVGGALIVIDVPGTNGSTCFSSDVGEFACPLPPEGVFSASVSADSFRTEVIEVTAGAAVRVRLALLPLNETVVVSAEARPGLIGETAASISVLDATDLRTSAGTGTDDGLRQIAGFTLFRRTTSRTANPTTQGASLRGVNPSGASRTTVLVDSSPLNDPFGGWIPWASVPSVELEAVEVLRGGASSLYGSDSIGGAISFRRKQLTRKNSFAAEAFGGTQETGSGSFFGGMKRKRFGLDATGSAFTTRGYVPVEEISRGAADEAAGSRHALLSARFSPEIRSLDPFIRVTYFRESRRNGTRLQRNALLSRRMEAGADASLPDFIPGTNGTALSLRAYATFQVFDQSFSAVSEDRDSESLVRIQRVPSQVAGFSARISTNAERNSILAGFEIDTTRGASDETGFFNGSPTTRTGAGGRERNVALYLQDRIAAGSRLLITGRVRIDSWKNYRALNRVESISNGNASTTLFADRQETAVSPGASVWISITDRISAYASASRSFRAPTLNELYRGFRVGDVLTLPNEDLKAERSANFEGGAAFWSEQFGLRASAFSTTIIDSVTNVTIDPGSSPIIRQRRNAAEVDVAGFEAEAELRIWSSVLTAGYLFARSRYASFPENLAVEGNSLPQSPSHSVTGQYRFEGRKGRTAGIQLRASSSQFDDDLNRFRLGAYLQADVFGSFRVAERASIFASIENLLNSRHTVGLSPVRTVAAPFGFRAGIRWN